VGPAALSRQVEEVMEGLQQLRADLSTAPELRVRLDPTTERWVSTVDSGGGRKDLDVELRVFGNIFASVLVDGAQWRNSISGRGGGCDSEASHMLALKNLRRTQSTPAEDTQSAPSSPSSARQSSSGVYRERETLSDAGRTDGILVSRVASSKALHHGLQHNLKEELQHEREATQGLVAWAKEATRNRTHVALMPTPWSRPSSTEKTQRHITFQIVGSPAGGVKTASDNGALLGAVGRRLTPNSPSSRGLRRSMSTESLGASILRSSDSFSNIKNSLPSS